MSEKTTLACPEATPQIEKYGEDAKFVNPLLKVNC